ncbi:MAG: HypC/HybG/HupF family hydrogenase formation chaperone [Acidaminococcaceae bacterium]|nr:HypC/HybG/HupF family hydrogenase formation chaperone [Acidaminococcaceae bacterium]
MCVAYPGKVLSVEKDHARVDFTGSVVPVNVSMVSVQPGDYVLVHAGMAIQKVETEEAKEWIALFRDLEEATDGVAEDSVSAASAANGKRGASMPEASHKLALSASAEGEINHA